MGNTTSKEIIITSVRVADILIKQSVGFIFNDTVNFDSITEINVFPKPPELEKPCIELVFAENSAIDILLFIQSVFRNPQIANPELPNNIFIFELSPVSYLANSLFYPQICEFVGYCFIDNNGASIDVSDLANLTNDQLYDPNTILLNTFQNNIRRIKLYFWNKTNIINYLNPTIIIRILSGLDPRFQKLIIKAIKSETINSPLPVNEAVAEDHFIYSCFDSMSFFNFYDNEQNYSKKVFYRSIITNEIDSLVESNIILDSGNYYNYFVRSNTLFDSSGEFEFLKSANMESIRLFFEDYVVKSPEGSLFCKINDLGESVFLSIFDSGYYQIDQIDLVTPNLKFSELPNSENSNDAVLIFNGSFFKELETDKAINTPYVWYATGIFPNVKGVPVGNYVFRNPQNKWNPKKVNKVSTPDYRQYTISFDSPEEWTIYPTNESRYYFAQEADGSTITGRTSSNTSWYTNKNVTVGCDNLVAFRINNNDISDLDTNGLIRDETDLPWYIRHLSPPEGTKKGFPFFGKIQKNDKEYFFTLTVEDCTKHNGLQACRDFLVSIGAKDIMFSDGASSTGLIINNNLLIKPMFFKDQLITTAISIKKNIVDFKDVLSRVTSKIELGGEFNEINNYVNNLSVQLSAYDRSTIISAIGMQRPIPDFLGMNVRSPFGNRINVFGGTNIKFHSGIDIDMAPGTNIFPVLPGKVHLTDTNGGWGNYIVIYHGHDLLKTKYYTLYAHNTSVVAAINSLVDKQTVIAISGATGNVTGPHLHLEVRIIKNGENFNILSKEIVKDPLNILFPKNLIIE